MSTLRLERDFPLPPEKVFEFVTQPSQLLQWWGHEGSVVTEHRLDFSQPGEWLSVLMTANGKTHKVSGTVLAVDPPHSVEFTWAWHDANDQRGHISTVRFDVTPNGRGGTSFALSHSGLLNEESVANNKKGWTSTFNKLKRTIQQ